MNEYIQQKNKLKKEALLERLKHHGSIGKACKAIGLSRNTLWKWRQNEFDFDVLVREAISIGKRNY